MDERTAHDIKQLLENVYSALTTEHSPVVKPVLQNLEIICETITAGNRQLAENQQTLYDAMQANAKELESQNQILRLQLNLAITQNKLLIEALSHHLPDSINATAALDAARYDTDKVNLAAQQLQPSHIANQFK